MIILLMRHWSPFLESLHVGLLVFFEGPVVREVHGFQNSLFKAWSMGD